MATKNNRRTLVTKKLLKNGLIELMQEKPISKITIKEICQQASLSRSTFYLHYHDEYELLTDIESEIITTVSGQLQLISDDADILTAILKFTHYIKKENVLFHTLLCNRPNTDFENQFIEQITFIILKMFPSSTLDETSETLYDYTLTFMMNGSLSIIKRWIEQDFDLSEKKIAQLILDLCKKTY